MMNYKAVFFLSISLTLAFSPLLRAQDVNIPVQSTSSSTGLTVNGHAEIDVKPDVAYASIGVVIQAADQADAVAQDAAKADSVKAALIKAGILDADIKTDSYQVQPQYDYRSGASVLVGYQVSNFFKVTIHNLSKAGVIVDRAAQAGANQVNGVTYDLADRSSVEGQALAAAVTNARSKADLMAGAAGVTVGRLLDLSETTTQNVDRPGPVMFAALAAPAAAPSTPIQEQDIVIAADVTAYYAIGYGK